MYDASRKVAPLDEDMLGVPAMPSIRETVCWLSVHVADYSLCMLDFGMAGSSA